MASHRPENSGDFKVCEINLRGFIQTKGVKRGMLGMHLRLISRNNEWNASPSKKLIFPAFRRLDYYLLLQWTIRLYKNYRGFQELYCLEYKKFYVTENVGKIIDYLVLAGFKKIQLVVEGSEGAKILEISYCFKLFYIKSGRSKMAMKIEYSSFRMVILKKHAPSRKAMMPICGKQAHSYPYPLSIVCSDKHLEQRIENLYVCIFCNDSHDSRECIEKVQKRQYTGKVLKGILTARRRYKHAEDNRRTPLFCRGRSMIIKTRDAISAPQCGGTDVQDCLMPFVSRGFQEMREADGEEGKPDATGEFWQDFFLDISCQVESIKVTSQAS